MPAIRLLVDCPNCRQPISVQVHPATAASATAGRRSEVYERCPKCARTFPLLVPAGLG
jgi:primosomal protein N'